MKYAIFALAFGLAAQAQAQEAKAADAEEWGKVNATVGLQMWTPILVTATGEISKPQLIGPVVKVHYAFTEMLGAHLRGTWGFNNIEVTPDAGDKMEITSSAFAASAGADFYIALGRKAMWYNTIGFAYGSGALEQDDVDHPDTSVFGPYFVTGFDVQLMGAMGVWMDWGCQAVGPVSASPKGAEVKTWHINPLGAGGMRFLF